MFPHWKCHARLQVSTAHLCIPTAMQREQPGEERIWSH